MSILSLLFDFRGRVTRTHYWIGLAIVYVAAPLILAACAFAAWGSLQSSGDDFTKMHAIVAFIGGLGILFIVVTVARICTMALVAKRLHDMNVSGLWCLAIFFAPAPLAALTWFNAMQMRSEFGGPFIGPGSIMLAFGATIVLGVIVLGFLPTKPGPNQYDHPPSPLPYPPETPTHEPHVQTAPRAATPQPATPGSFGRRVSR